MISRTATAISAGADSTQPAALRPAEAVRTGRFIRLAGPSAAEVGGVGASLAGGEFVVLGGQAGQGAGDRGLADERGRQDLVADVDDVWLGDVVEHGVHG